MSGFTNPKAWSENKKVSLGDIFIVIDADVKRDSNLVLGDYYEALFKGRIVNSTPYYYPSGNGSANSKWQWRATKDDWVAVTDVSIQTTDYIQTSTIYANGLNMIGIEVHMTPTTGADERGENIRPITNIDKGVLLKQTSIVNYTTGEELTYKGNWAPTITDLSHSSHDGWCYTTKSNNFTNIDKSKNIENSIYKTSNSVAKYVLIFYVYAAKDLTPDQGKQGISIGLNITPTYNEINPYIGTRREGDLTFGVAIKVIPKPEISVDDFKITKNLNRPDPQYADDAPNNLPSITPNSDMLWRQFNFTIEFNTGRDPYNRKIVDSKYNIQPTECKYIDKITNGYQTSMFLFPYKDTSGNIIPNSHQIDLGSIGMKTFVTNTNSNTIVLTYIMYLAFDSASSVNSFDCNIEVYDQYGNGYIIYPSYILPATYFEVQTTNSQAPSWEYFNSNLISVDHPVYPNSIEKSSFYTGLYNPKTQGYLFNCDKDFTGDSNLAFTGFDLTDPSNRNINPSLDYGLRFNSLQENGKTRTIISSLRLDESSALYPVMEGQHESMTYTQVSFYSGKNPITGKYYFLPIWNKQQIIILVLNFYDSWGDEVPRGTLHPFLDKFHSSYHIYPVGIKPVYTDECHWEIRGIDIMG